MPILCCCRSSRRAPQPGSEQVSSEPNPQSTPLPVCPPPAKLRKTPYPVEANIPPAAPSLMTTPMQAATVDLADLDIEDSDSEDERNDNRNSSTSTLEALRAKLVRRRSQRSEDKRRSQAGSSEDELARRAELRRLRHKRIQEELQQDEGSKHDDSSLLGPRDAIEFVIFGSKEMTEEPQMPASPQLAPVHVSSGSVGSWRLSTQLPRENRDEQRSLATEDVNTEELAREAHDTTLSANATTFGRSSPLDMWLRTQDAQLDSTQHSSSHYVTQQNVHDTPAKGTSDASSYKTAPLEVVAASEALHAFETSAATEAIADVQPHRAPSRSSETVSFKEREAELQSITKRFVGSDLRRDPSRPVISRFREEFEERPKSKATSKPKLLSKLHLPKKGKVLEKSPQPHRNCVADAIEASHLAAAGPNAHIAARGSRTGSTVLRPVLVESATDLWQRAIRLEADRREAQRREKDTSTAHQCLEDAKREPTAPQHLQPVRRPSSAYSNTHSGLPSGLHSPRSKNAPPRPKDSDEGLHGSLETSNRILDEWQQQIQSEESAFERTPSFTARVYATQKKSRTPPISWAKWPSHTRSDRAGAAGQTDRVVPRDFAAMGTASSGDTKWSTDRERASTPNLTDLKHQPRSFSGKLGRAVRGSFAKMIKSALDVEGSAEERRKSRKSTGYLEYPELELLPTPGGYQEVQALERQIDNIRRNSIVSLECGQHHPSAGATKTPLSVRVAQGVHDIQHGSERAGTTSVGDLLSSPTSKQIHPVTPSKKRFSSPQPWTAPVAPFATPLTQISYDDCVQKHMLDENDSIKSAATVMVKRSKSNAETTLPGKNGPNKYATWNGRVMKASVKLKSTREFSAELEKMLACEKEKVLVAISKETEKSLAEGMKEADRTLDGAKEMEITLNAAVKELESVA